MTEDQTYLFEEQLKEARMEYPDSLDYNLQVLCYKLAVDGTLDTDISPEELASKEIANLIEESAFNEIH